MIAATKHNIFETMLSVLGSGSVGTPNPKVLSGEVMLCQQMTPSRP
jgi:hypothetical protein